MREFATNSDDDRSESPNFFGRLYDKIKAEYFDKSNSRDGSPQKSSASGTFFTLNKVKKVRNPSLKSSVADKRVSFMGEIFDRNY